MAWLVWTWVSVLLVLSKLEHTFVVYDLFHNHFLQPINE